MKNAAHDEALDLFVFAADAPAGILDAVTMLTGRAPAVQCGRVRLIRARMAPTISPAPPNSIAKIAGVTVRPLKQGTALAALCPRPFSPDRVIGLRQGRIRAGPDRRRIRNDGPRFGKGNRVGLSPIRLVRGGSLVRCSAEKIALPPRYFAAKRASGC